MMAKSVTSILILSTLFVAAISAPQRKTDEISRTSAAHTSDMTAAESIAVSDYQVQSVKPRSSANRRYGYPYLIAPTLPPFLKNRADTFENEAVHVPPVPPVPAVTPGKSFGSRISSSEDDVSLKKSYRKKNKLAFVESANRRQGYDDDEESSAERRLRLYREPTYRNFHDLESMFRPRMDTGITFTDYGYPSKSQRRPSLSPRDPYLSPSGEPTDGFYPSSPKIKTHSSSYGTSSGPIGYGAGAYDSSDGYDIPPPSVHSSSYDSGPSKYPSTGGHYDYHDSYSIESNKPIVGDIRKRLLDFAGASDLYEGEPDYLKEVGRNKHKYGSIGNEYYPYGGPDNSFRDFYYGESNVKEARARKNIRA